MAKVVGAEPDRQWRAVQPGGDRGPSDEFKRYVPIAFTFDTRHMILDPLPDGVSPDVRAQAEQNRRALAEAIAHEHGGFRLEEKLKNLHDLGRGAWSVVASHTNHLKEVRDAFISTHYYPALLGACGLGERILNQLVLGLREDFAEHPGTTATIAKKNSFDNWKAPIEALRAWGVLDGEARDAFLELARLRNRSVHYGVGLDRSSSRPDALAALSLLRDVVEHVFQPLGGGAKFFSGPLGRQYIRRDSESDPLIRKYFLPASALVSPLIKFVHDGRGGLDVHDVEEWDGPAALSDLEFQEWRSVRGALGASAFGA